MQTFDLHQGPAILNLPFNYSSCLSSADWSHFVGLGPQCHRIWPADATNTVGPAEQHGAVVWSKRAPRTAWHMLFVVALQEPEEGSSSMSPQRAMIATGGDHDGAVQVWRVGPDWDGSQNVSPGGSTGAPAIQRVLRGHGGPAVKALAGVPFSTSPTHPPTIQWLAVACLCGLSATVHCNSSLQQP